MCERKYKQRKVVYMCRGGPEHIHRSIVYISGGGLEHIHRSIVYLSGAGGGGPRGLGVACVVWVVWGLLVGKFASNA